MNQDEEYLRLLSIFHYVVATLMGMFACFPVFHLAVGIFFLAAPEEIFEGSGDPPPPEMRAGIGLLFTLIPSLIILTGWTLAACVAYAGRCVAHRKRYTFCLVIAALMCAFMPFGTVLGVLTILVLVRPSVKPLFGKHI
jgi:hypothetical protein